MDITFDRHDDILCVTVSGRLESSDALAFEKTIRTSIEDRDRAVLMDLESLAYISSAGLRAIFMTASSVEKRNAQFALCSLPDAVLEIFRLSGLDQLITLHPSRAEAIVSLQSAPA